MEDRKKNIIMLLGTGINERGWAAIISRYGCVTLLQIGFAKHEETWENGQRTYSGPEIRLSHRLRSLDDALLGAINFFRAWGLILRLRRKGPIDLVITGYYSTGLAAIFAQKLGLVSRTVSFLADYLPPRGSFLVRTHRRITGWLVKLAARWSDEAWVLSSRISTALDIPKSFVEPVSVGHYPAKTQPARVSIGYIGFPSADHSLEILFDIAKRHGFPLDIIGASPYLETIRHLAPSNTVFHGVINDEKRIGEILARCFCSYAIYRDLSPNSYSYYGFPSKTLYSFASNVPVVVTAVAEFNQEFGRRGVGRVVPPEPAAIESAILDIKQNYDQYSAAIDRFRDEWNQHVEKFHAERLAKLLNTTS
ncbi:MAG TPA: hypothetical protein VKV04_14860 [Verrucomicrobiae bacterium]|nr:hypothetical protein [Verrucomicrobiae bacterium]